MPMKEIKDDSNRWKEIHHALGLEESNIVKMTTLHKTVYRFSAIPIKLPMAFFTEAEQKFFKFVGNTKDPKQPKQS